MEDSIFILSNGSMELYPDNSLSSFQNNLPRIFTLDKNSKFEVAIQKIGFSTDFRLIKRENNEVSFIICQLKLRPAKRKDQKLKSLDFLMKMLANIGCLVFQTNI